MSDSPQSNSKDVEQGAPSPGEEPQMNDPQDPHSSGLNQYEFEVKEQDRWLPIANGMLHTSSLLPFLTYLPLPVRPSRGQASGLVSVPAGP